MKLFRTLSLALGLTAALAVGGCAGFSFGSAVSAVGTVLTGGTVANVAPVTLGDAEKTLTLAHNAVNYFGAELLYNAQTPAEGGSGLLHGPAAATARVYFDKAVAALKIADQADAVANTAGILDAVSQAQGFVAQFKALAGTNGLAAPPGLTPPADH